MTELETLTRLLALHAQGYALMRWLGDGVARDTVAFQHVQHGMETPGAARAWIERNLEALPIGMRPAPDDVETFANLLSTYLETSFELLPGRTTRVESDGCRCWMCTWTVDASNLMPRTPGRYDKDLARQLCREVAGDLVDDPALRAPIAMVAWTRELRRRALGIATGPAVLVLWRRFAWTPQGSPRRDFTVRAEDLLAAEATVAAARAR